MVWCSHDFRVWLDKAIFTSPLKNFSPIQSIFRHMYGVLNVNQKNFAQFSCKS